MLGLCVTVATRETKTRHQWTDSDAVRACFCVTMTTNKKLISYFPS